MKKLNSSLHLPINYLGYQYNDDMVIALLPSTKTKLMMAKSYVLIILFLYFTLGLVTNTCSNKTHTRRKKCGDSDFT